MRYTEFQGLIRDELLEHPDGMTWRELKSRLDLPYDRPCQTWIGRMEQEIGLSRGREGGRAFIWKVTPES
jgi:hypothetical protein